jgi:hydrogenase/urease accessory protein HupE
MLALAPAAAQAHLDTTGLGPVYDGVSHLLLSPDDLVPVLAMAALAGLNGPVAGRRTMFALTLAWLAGGLAGFAFGRPVVPGAATIASFLALGVLVALDRRLAPAVVSSLAVALGLLHGWLNGAGIAGAGREAMALAGLGGAIFVIVALAAALVVTVAHGWRRIAVRVLGSWVAAVGLLMLGWTLRTIG